MPQLIGLGEATRRHLLMSNPFSRRSLNPSEMPLRHVKEATLVSPKLMFTSGNTVETFHYSEENFGRPRNEIEINILLMHRRLHGCLHH